MSTKKYRVVVEERFCKGCGICVKFCPAGILELTATGQLKVVNEDRCLGCKTCEIRCPDFAVIVEAMD
ncbi:MAG: 4Fe-4S binding protein [Peptococcaceae bacterium]|nr:4Fe-4S binding protein [Peptococcaceae bacterium]MDH7524647.1 4Fe-4S binding protein [Peptococcaceae bacterium]